MHGHSFVEHIYIFLPLILAMFTAFKIRNPRTRIKMIAAIVVVGVLGGLAINSEGGNDSYQSGGSELSY